MLATWLAPVLVLAFTGAIVVARVALPREDPSTIVPTPTEAATFVETTTETPSPTPTPFVADADLPRKRLDGVDLTEAEPATVKRVVDGDTLEVDLAGAAVTIRMYGIDAPEEGDKPDRCGPEAAAQLKALLPDGTALLLLADKRDQDRYERTLRYVFTPDGVSVDAQMVAAGFAEAWRSDGAYKKQLIALQEDATLHQRGCLWGS